MNAFEYANPKSLDEAVGLLSNKWGETEVLAGGTDLLSSFKQNLTSAGRVVSLSKIGGLAGISEKDGKIHIGSMTRLSEFVGNEKIREHFPALVTAAQNIGSSQILNMGTVGGDLLQRPRCWFYRQGMGLFGTHDGKSVVPDSDNRYHAIFGNRGPAYFVNPSSLAPGLLALDATMTAQGSSGSREIKASDFFQTPKSEDDREYTLTSSEILTGITIPLQGLRNATYEVRQRQGLDWPMVAVAVAFEYGGEARTRTASNARVVLGHVAPTPWYSEAASKALEGAVVQSASLAYFGFNDETGAKVGEAAVKSATPLSRNGYKVHQVKIAVARAIEAACPTRREAWTENR